MNFIGRQLNVIGILLPASFATAAAGLYFDVPGRIQQARLAQKSKAPYTCPMHPNVMSDQPGDCPHCGMRWVVLTAANSAGAGCCSAERAAPHAVCSHESQTR